MIQRIKANKKRILASLLILSLLETVYVIIFDTTIRELKDEFTIVLVLTLLSELLFLSGIVLMAYAAEHDLGINPLKWRSKIPGLVNHVAKSRLFWVGFWMNTAGAVLTGAVWSFGILFGLPIAAWGILWLPILDIILTISIRKSILNIKPEESGADLA